MAKNIIDWTGLETTVTNLNAYADEINSNFKTIQACAREIGPNSEIWDSQSAAAFLAKYDDNFGSQIQTLLNSIIATTGDNARILQEEFNKMQQV